METFQKYLQNWFSAYRWNGCNHHHSHSYKIQISRTHQCNNISFAVSNSLRWLQTKAQSLWLTPSHLRGTVSNRWMPYRWYWNSTATIATWTTTAVCSVAEQNIVAQQFTECARHKKVGTAASRTECFNAINISIRKSQQVSERFVAIGNGGRIESYRMAFCSLCRAENRLALDGEVTLRHWDFRQFIDRMSFKRTNNNLKRKFSRKQKSIVGNHLIR